MLFTIMPVFASAQRNTSDNLIRVGSFEETYNTVNEKGADMVMSIFKILRGMQAGHMNM